MTADTVTVCWAVLGFVAMTSAAALAYLRAHGYF